MFRDEAELEGAVAFWTDEAGLGGTALLLLLLLFVVVVVVVVAVRSFSDGGVIVGRVGGPEELPCDTVEVGLGGALVGLGRSSLFVAELARLGAVVDCAE
jgi:hypothetical protein